MKELVVNEGMLKIKDDLEVINTNLEVIVKDINTNLDSVVSNWEGNKSKVVLSPVENIKAKNIDIITRIKAKTEEIKQAYDTYLRNSDTTIQEGTTTSSVPVVSTSIGSEEQITDETKTTINPISEDIPYSTSPGFVSPSTYVDEYLNKIINYVKTGYGASPFDNEDMMSISSLYNSTPNIRTQGAGLLNDYDKNLAIIREELIKNNLWGTPAASSILMHYTVKTGFRIPTVPSTETDGVGNYRYLGANEGWLNKNNGMDCNNVLTWVAINSGRMAEGRHMDVPTDRNNGTIRLDGKNLTGNSLFTLGITPGDNAGRKGHATVFMYEDNDNIYVFESVSNKAAVDTRKLNEGGTMITVIPKNPDGKVDRSISVKWPRSHINFFVPFENIPQMNNPAKPSTIIK